MNQKTNRPEEIDLLDTLFAVLQKWWAIVLATIIFAVGSFLITFFFITPKYTASVKMYVNNSSDMVAVKASTISQSDISAAKTLVDTYGVILKTRLTLDEVIKKAKLDYTYEELSAMVSSDAVNNTEAFQVDVVSEDPQEACKIANTIAEVLPNKISNVVEGSSVSVVDLAVVPEKKTTPSYPINISVGAAIGFILSTLIVVLAYLFNDIIESEDWLRDEFGDEVPVLAVIPDVYGKGNGGKYSYNHYSSYYYHNPSRYEHKKEESK